MLFYPYVFTGKERDEETGYGYFGARYYWSELLTGWLSVDPMMDKYPNISPYAYCIWNPVKLTDPNGEVPILYGLLQYQGLSKHGEAKVIINPNIDIIVVSKDGLRQIRFDVNHPASRKNPHVHFETRKSPQGPFKSIRRWPRAVKPE